MEPAKDISKGSVALGGRNTLSAQSSFAGFPTWNGMPTSIGDGSDWLQERGVLHNGLDAGFAIRSRQMLNLRPIQYTAIVMFALVGALICFGASYGAAESKRLERVNQERNVVWQK